MLYLPVLYPVCGIISCPGVPFPCLGPGLGGGVGAGGGAGWGIPFSGPVGCGGGVGQGVPYPGPGQGVLPLPSPPRKGPWTKDQGPVNRVPLLTLVPVD